MQQDAQATIDAGRDGLSDQLAEIIGRENVQLDEARRRLFSEDIWRPVDSVVAMVAAPGSLAELA